MKVNQVKWGAILSYILIILNTAYGLLVVPFILACLGENQYGVYKTVASLSASLSVLDLGIGSTMTRYMARYNAKKDLDGANNFAAMAFIQYAVIAAVLAIGGAIAFISLTPVYGNTFSTADMALAQKLLITLVLNMILRLLENLFVGIANGHERFVFSNSIKLISVILRFSLIFIVLPIFNNALVIALLETAVVSVMTVVFAVYTTRNIGVRPKLKKWDKEIFKESMGYTLLMFIQTIVIQFNGNVDNVVIGARISAASVTVYSMALSVFGMYENLSGSIAGIMLPNMTKMVVAGDCPERLQAGVEKAGRMQFVLLAAALGGFVVLGRDFFDLWLGDGFQDCYALTLMLMIPVTFSMMQNVSLSILRAQNKMRYRTVTLVISCCINMTLTFLGVKYLGYWGAALGTSCATISNLIFMNIYYKKHLKFKVFRLFENVMKRTWLCSLVASVVTAVVHYWLRGTWVSFLLNVAIFIAIYGLAMFAWGLDTSEKKLIFGRFVRT